MIKAEHSVNFVATQLIKNMLLIKPIRNYIEPLVSMYTYSSIFRYIVRSSDIVSNNSFYNKSRRTNKNNG